MNGILAQSALGAGVVLASLAALFAALRYYRRRRDPNPEVLRKLLHTGMGVVALSFPWLFPSPWPVAALAALAAAGLLLLRRSAALQARFGGVIDGVQRDSLGELYFPLAVAAVFALSRGQPVLFCVPVLLLAVSDAAAALVGVYYGRLRYTTSDGQKSAEGSVAFFVTAFLSIHVPLLLFTEVARAQTLLVALSMAFLATLLEASAWRGLDNLFIPLGGYLILRAYLHLDLGELLVRFGLTAALVVFAWLWRRRSTLIDSALFAAALVGFASWTLGGWRWIAAPLVFFLAYNRLRFPAVPNRQRVHDERAVLAVAAPGFLWLAAAVETGDARWLYPFTLAYASNLAIAGVAEGRFRDRSAGPWRLPAASAALAWLLEFLPYLLVGGGRSVAALLAAAPLTWAAAALFDRLQPGMDDCPADTGRWMWQAAVCAFSSGLGLVTLLWVGP